MVSELVEHSNRAGQEAAHERLTQELDALRLLVRQAHALQHAPHLAIPDLLDFTCPK